MLRLEPQIQFIGMNIQLNMEIKLSPKMRIHKVTRYLLVQNWEQYQFFQIKNQFL